MSDKPYKKEAVYLAHVNVPYRLGGSIPSELNVAQLPAGTKHVSFLNTGINTIYIKYNDDADASNFQLLPTGGNTFRITAKSMEKLYFFVVEGSTSSMNIQGEGV